MIRYVDLREGGWLLGICYVLLCLDSGVGAAG